MSEVKLLSHVQLFVTPWTIGSCKPEKRGREGGSRGCLISWASSHSEHAELQGKGGEEERLSIEMQFFMPAWMAGELGVERICVWLSPFTVHLELLQHY